MEPERSKGCRELLCREDFPLLCGRRRSEYPFLLVGGQKFLCDSNGKFSASSSSNKKQVGNRRLQPINFVLIRIRLSLVDCFARAVFCASATADANVRVNFIDIALRDCFHGATCSASAASYTVVINYVSHFSKDLNLFLLIAIQR